MTPGRQWDDTLCTDVYYNTGNRDFTRYVQDKDKHKFHVLQIVFENGDSLK